VPLNVVMVFVVELILSLNSQLSWSLELDGRCAAGAVRNTAICRVITQLVEMFLRDDRDLHLINKFGHIDCQFPVETPGLITCCTGACA
jgi:hypothetical protein